MLLTGKILLVYFKMLFKSDSEWDVRVRVMVFNATFNNISVILWWSVLLTEETGAPGENHKALKTL
jgi:hypothetical protein